MVHILKQNTVSRIAILVIAFVLLVAYPTLLPSHAFGATATATDAFTVGLSVTALPTPPPPPPPPSSGDTTPPNVTSFNPSNGATGVSPTTTLRMTMSETVNKFSGNILVKRVSDNSIAETVSVSGAQVAVSGSLITITLTTPLQNTTSYYIEVPGGAFADTAGNSFVGFAGSATWSFTVADTTAPIISAVSATSTYTTGTITFTTNESAQATIEWGLTSTYGAGTISEVGFTTSHSMTITGLATSTLYYYRITARDASNNNSTPFTGMFTTATPPIPPDTTPPANPSNFTGTPGMTNIALSWINPSDPDFAAVRVMRMTSGYPGTPTGGVLVYEGTGTAVNDTGLSLSTLYYYTAFARDGIPNYSSGALYSGTTGTTPPPPPPPPPIPPTPTPTPPTPPPGTPPPPPTPGGPTPAPVTPPPAPPGGSPETTWGLSLRDVIFTQITLAPEVSEERLLMQNGVVRTNGKKNLRVAIPYIVLPEVLKTIKITITNPNSSGATSEYLLRINAVGSFYDTVLPPFQTEGDYLFTISIQDHERNIVSRINGTLRVFFPVVPPTFFPPAITQAVTDIIENVREPIANMSPAATGVGVAVGVSQAVLLTTNVTSVYDLYLLLLKFIGLITGLFRKKRNEPWGVVYDSVTKRPLDPAYVIAQIQGGTQSKGEAITDLDGRYGFLLSPGEYHIVANKTHYKFPSEKLKGAARDELYENLYYGDPFQVREGGVVQYNIPLDPVEFDWNEFAKNQDKVFQVYSKKQNIRRWIFNITFYIGFLFSSATLFLTPTPLNMGVVGIYVLILAFQIFWHSTHKITRVMNKTTGKSLPFALIKVWYPGLNTAAKKVVTDELGRFYFLVPPGNYYVTVEAKQPDGTYKEVLRTEPMELKRGVVKQDFLV